jgi:Tfp pilus assembly protein PilO
MRLPVPVPVPVRVVLLTRYLLRDRSIALLAITAFAACLCWLISLLIWNPVLQEHAVLSAEIKTLSERHRQQQANQEGLVAAGVALEGLETWDARVMQQADRVVLMTSVVDMAASNGMTILGQTYEESKEDAGLSMLRQEISFQGQYGNIRGFLFGLAELPGLTRVEELSIERATPELVRGRLRLINYRRLVSTP